MTGQLLIPQLVSVPAVDSHLSLLCVEGLAAHSRFYCRQNCLSQHGCCQKFIRATESYEFLLLCKKYLIMAFILNWFTNDTGCSPVI